LDIVVIYVISAFYATDTRQLTGGLTCPGWWLWTRHKCAWNPVAFRVPGANRWWRVAEAGCETCHRRSRTSSTDETEFSPHETRVWLCLRNTCT